MKRLTAVGLCIGLTLALLPLLMRAYSGTKQWQLHKEWDAALQATQARDSSFGDENAGSPENASTDDSDLNAPAGASHAVGAGKKGFAPESVKVDNGQAKSKAVKSAPRRGRASSAPNSPVTSADYNPGSYEVKPPIEMSPGGAAVAQPRLRPHPLTDQWPLRLRIPRLRLNVFVVKNVTNRALAGGPGHFPETALPWQTGNCVIAGHLNIWGSWFDHLSRLKPGDQVILETVRHRYIYRVTGHSVVSPTDTAVLKDHGARRELTLLTCTRGATHRLVAHAIYVRTVPTRA